MNFPGQNVVVRAISLNDLPGKSHNELVSLIFETGTDRTDPDIKGHGYDDYDFYGARFYVFSSIEAGKHYIRQFYLQDYNMRTCQSPLI